MADYTQIRIKLQDKVFTPYGTSVTLYHRGTPTYNNRGDITADSMTTSTISIVPYDVETQSMTFESLSKFIGGEFFAAIPYSVTISVGDQIVLNGDTYEAKTNLSHLLPGNVVTIMRFTKMVS